MPKDKFARPKKAEPLLNYYESMIVTGQLSAGSKLPPLRTLQEQFHLSYSTIQRGIAYLRSRGLLEKSGKEILIGSSSRREECKILRQITVFISPWRLHDKQGIFMTALQGLEKTALEHGYRILLTPLDQHYDPIVQIRQSLSFSSGAVFLQEVDQVFCQVPPSFPCVGISTVNDFGGRMTLIDLDPINCAEQAVEYLMQRGVKCVRTCTDNRPSYQMRTNLFEQRWILNGGTVLERIGLPIQEFIPIPYDPTVGIFFSSDNVAHLYAEEYARQHPGKQLYREIPIISMDGKRMLMPDFQPFPTIAADWFEIGCIAFEELLMMIEYPGRRRRRIWMPCRLELPGEE